MPLPLFVIVGIGAVTLYKIVASSDSSKRSAPPSPPPPKDGTDDDPPLNDPFDPYEQDRYGGGPYDD